MINSALFDIAGWDVNAYVAAQKEKDNQVHLTNFMFHSNIYYLRYLLFFVASNIVVTKYISSVLNVCVYGGVGSLKMLL